MILSIFNPHREKLATYRGYDIRTLESNFRSITVLKNRYGEADVEVGCAFYGSVSVFKELPRPDEIYDYGKYTDTTWLLHPEEEVSTQSEDAASDLITKFVL